MFEEEKMDKLDKFNNVVLDLSLNWKYIYYFVAGLFIIATFLSLASVSKIALVIVCWAILVGGAVVMHFVLGEKKISSKETEQSNIL